jgi:predicted Zn-dependent peptidase
LRELLRGEYLSVDEVLRKIDQVTLADLQRVAELVLVSDQLRLAIIGNFKNATELQQAMS